MAAAVADYRPAQVLTRKHKKSGEGWEVQLVPNPDILAELGASRSPDQWLVGFAAETEDLLAHAMNKLTRKGLDCIVANDVSIEGLGFGSDRNAVTVLTREGPVLSSGPATKEAIAVSLWDLWTPCLASRSRT
jgi:phosphopantothenoylcysteine decarboxylase/phosphopantothenate--cysteine ligase